MLPLARVPLARLVRAPQTWLIVVAWSAVALVTALVVRATGQTSGADHVMRGAFPRFVFPLLMYGIAGAAIGKDGLKRGIRGVVALGARPRRAAFASAVVSAIACAVVGALLSALVCGAAHGPADPPLGRDLPTSAWVGLLGGAAYGAYYAAGSSIGRGGGFRAVFLIADFVLGGLAGAGAALTPRAHVISLFGGPLAADLSQRASSVVLVLLLSGYIALAALLTRRAR